MCLHDEGLEKQRWLDNRQTHLCTLWVWIVPSPRVTNSKSCNIVLKTSIRSRGTGFGAGSPDNDWKNFLIADISSFKHQTNEDSINKAQTASRIQWAPIPQVSEEAAAKPVTVGLQCQCSASVENRSLRTVPTLLSRSDLQLSLTGNSSSAKFALGCGTNVNKANVPLIITESKGENWGIWDPEPVLYIDQGFVSLRSTWLFRLRCGILLCILRCLNLA